MAKYRVLGVMTISVHVDVEAKNATEARRIAESAGIMSLCHQCASGEEGAWSTSGELDSEPEIESVERIGGAS